MSSLTDTLGLGAILAPDKMKRTLAGEPGRGETSSVTTPVLFGPNKLRTPERRRALRQTTPFLTERALKGVDPREREQLKTRAFEDIGLSTKQALEGLRETFGRTGVRGGAQGADVADILEAAIGAKGAAGTDIEQLLKGESRQRLQDLLALLTSPEPYAVATKGRQAGVQAGAKPGLLDFINVQPIPGLSIGR